MTTPANNKLVSEVRIFKADSNGKALGPVNVYDRNGTTSCPLPDGTAELTTLANTGEPFYLVNRSGNRPSHEGAAERFAAPEEELLDVMWNSQRAGGLQSPADGGHHRRPT